MLKEKGIQMDLQKLERIVGSIKERCEFVKDLWDQGHFFFQAPDAYDEKTVRTKWKPDTSEKLQALTSLFETVGDWNAASIKEAFSEFMTQKEWGFGAVMVPVRLALVGSPSGPDLFEIFELIGKEETIGRIKKACETIVVN
jgi:glutamyl-tRNA synthetase